MEPTIVSKPAFIAVGLGYRGKNENEEIPKLWQGFGPRFKEIEGVIDGDVCYGICDNMDESSGEFNYVAAVEVSGGGDIPEGMVCWDIPEQTYAVFICTLPTIGQAFDHIYKTWLPQSGYKRACGPEFERYDKEFDPNDPSSEMEIYIPIE